MKKKHFDGVADRAGTLVRPRSLWLVKGFRKGGQHRFQKNFF